MRRLQALKWILPLILLFCPALLLAQGPDLPKAIWLTAQDGEGLEVSGTFSRRQGQMYMELTFKNTTAQAMDDFAMQFNANSFGLAPEPLQFPAPIPPNVSVDKSLLLSSGGPVKAMNPLNTLQVAVKNNVGVSFFNCLVTPHILFVENGKIENSSYVETWQSMPPSNEVQTNVGISTSNAEMLQAALERGNIFTVNGRTVGGQHILYQSLRFTNDVLVLAELKITPGNPTAQLAVKTQAMDLIPLVQSSYAHLLQASSGG